MSHECTNAVREHRFGSTNRKAVMYVLADYADANWSCFVGQSRLAAEAEVGERTVRRILAELENEGLIRREKRYGGLMGRTSDRTFLVREAIENLPASLAASSDDEHDLPANRADLPANGDRPTGQSLAGEPLEEPLEEPLVVQQGEKPDFDGRNVYRYWAGLIGFDRCTPGQQNLIDQYIAMASGDYYTVASAMFAIPNPRRSGSLAEVGDLIASSMGRRKVAA